MCRQKTGTSRRNRTRIRAVISNAHPPRHCPVFFISGRCSGVFLGHFCCCWWWWCFCCALRPGVLVFVCTTPCALCSLVHALLRCWPWHIAALQLESFFCSSPEIEAVFSSFLRQKCEEIGVSSDKEVEGGRGFGVEWTAAHKDYRALFEKTFTGARRRGCFGGLNSVIAGQLQNDATHAAAPLPAISSRPVMLFLWLAGFCTGRFH